MSSPNVGLRDALVVLETDCNVIRNLVNEGHTVPWFGSAISKERMPDLKFLILKLLELLYAKCDPRNPTCAYRLAIREILALVSPQKSVHADTDPASWDVVERDSVITQLVGKYSTILSFSVTTPSGEANIRWDILNLIGIYSDPTIEEDAEHVFIALLMREGLWPQAVTTNWDGLIEKADEIISDGITSPLATIASEDDLSTNRNHSSVLYKIHGCAKKAAIDPARYKQFMVAIELEIGQWANDANRRAFREAIRTLIRTKTILFIGLSGQDFNIKLQAIATGGQTTYSPTAPRIAFATTAISHDHRTFLSAFYTEQGFLSQKELICQQATVPLYGKPLLGGIWVDLLFSKCQLVLDRSSDLRPTSKANAERALGFVKDSICKVFDDKLKSMSLDDAWRWLAHAIPTFLSTCISIFREQKQLVSAGSYSPLVPGNLSMASTDTNLPLLRFHWLLWTLGLFVEGFQAGRWGLKTSIDGRLGSSPLALHCSGKLRPLFIVNDHIQGKVKCLDNGVIDETDCSDSIVVYPFDRRPRTVSRSPRSTFRVRLSSDEPQEIWLGDVYHESDSDDDALEALVLEIA